MHFLHWVLLLQLDDYYNTFKVSYKFFSVFSYFWITKWVFALYIADGNHTLHARVHISYPHHNCDSVAGSEALWLVAMALVFTLSMWNYCLNHHRQEVLTTTHSTCA